MLGKKLIQAATPTGNPALDVFSPQLYTGTGTTQTIQNGIDLAGEGGLVWIKSRSTATSHQLFDTQRGTTIALSTNLAADEATDANSLTAFNSDGFDLASSSNVNTNGTTYASWTFRKATGFFDVVPYVPSGSTKVVAHSLGVIPELIIVKSRTGATYKRWWIHHKDHPSNHTLDFTTAASSATGGFSSLSSASFTASVSIAEVSVPYISYLFATLPGISKVGSYTGTGATLDIDCGFTAGARFVMIKRREATGFWYMWDTSRGIVSGNDPFLYPISATAEDATTDYIDPLSSGFQISSTAPADINANGGSYIYLAIA